MTSKIYDIFGKLIRVNFDNSFGSSVLQKELSLYPIIAQDKNPDLDIFCQSHQYYVNQGFTNPSIHQELDNGFIANFGSSQVEFLFDNKNLKRINFIIKPSSSKIKKYIQKLRSIQYCSVEESIGQIFHELVLIPSVYFQTNQFLLHASALKSSKSDVILIGGTGGVGKTSLELELCLKHGFQFVSDDVCVASQNGWIWSNLAYPKIYAYNLENNDKLTKKLFLNSSLTNRLHWALNQKRGKNKVRRRISPEKLYDSFSQEGGLVKKYLILARAEQDEIQVSKISHEVAVHMSLPIIEAEYNIFNNHILWHQFNSYLQDKEPYTSLQNILIRWRELALQALSQSSCFLIVIPLRIEHSKFKDKVASIIRNMT
jgi:hypothetical protein